MGRRFGAAFCFCLWSMMGRLLRDVDEQHRLKRWHDYLSPFRNEAGTRTARRS